MGKSGRNKRGVQGGLEEKQRERGTCRVREVKEDSEKRRWGERERKRSENKKTASERLRWCKKERETEIEGRYSRVKDRLVEGRVMKTVRQ